ncbi:MAG: hypothetical protein HRT65_13950 [Flavobacteriaceae bacterium]|nr:hypothetical protein [Flavobacteriaceae bacterium]
MNYKSAGAFYWGIPAGRQGRDHDANLDKKTMKKQYGTAEKLRTYEMVLPVLMIPICGLTALGCGWQCYATLTDRPGLRGTIHTYFDLTAGQFATYNFVVAFLATGLIFFQTKYLIDKDTKKLKWTFWSFGLLVGMVTLAQIYLQARFVPKG